MNILKTMKIWVCWNWVVVNGDRQKKPCSAEGAVTGSAGTYRETWVTYDEAAAAAEKNNYNGVGFVIPDGYFFLDIDHKDINDSLTKTLLERFDTYAETSVSGDGFHVYGKCDRSKIPTYLDAKGQVRLEKNYYQKNPQKGIELYIGGLTNRFAIFTDGAIKGKELKDCTSAVLTTLDKDMRKKPKAKYSPKRDGDRETYDIVDALRKQKNGDRFSQLYDHGDITGYKTQSEADVALCAMIAFRVGEDPGMIDRIFAGSALYRDKWDREDYKTATIEAGIESCHGNFFIRHDEKLPPFVKINECSGSKVVVVPLLAEYIREHIRYIAVRDNGKQAIRYYVYENGVYRLYSKEMMIGVIKAPVQDYDMELVKMNQMNEAFMHINTDLDCLDQGDLDAREDLINFQNGFLRVTAEGAELLPHTPDVHSTIQIPCKWTGQKTETPVFDNYLKTLTNGEEELEWLLLEFIGACLSNIKGWRMKKALFMVGAGDTGKSQLKSLTEKILGRRNYIGIDLKEIEARFGTGVLYGTRLAGSSDMSFLSVDELKTFKSLTGGDSVFAEFKGQQGFEYTYNGLLWFCMNRLPKFGGDDGKWVYDRIIVVPCNNVIPKDKQDKQLLDKMYAERDGIVYKSVKALQRVIANGYRFTEPQSVKDARETYMAENNTVIAFFEECMCKRDGDFANDPCTAGRIYNVYKAWCADNNNGYAKTMREFRETLSSHLGKTYDELTFHCTKGTMYLRLTLNDDTKSRYSRALWN